MLQHSKHHVSTATVIHTTRDLCRGYICRIKTELREVSSVEVGSNTSTITLRVVGGDEKGTQCLGYNWDTLFLGDINIGTGHSRLLESWMWESKMWSWDPRDSDLRMSALARASSNCKWQTHSLISVQLEKNYWSWVSKGWSPRQTDWRKPPAIK
jgi:hypothetical protein